MRELRHYENVHEFLQAVKMNKDALTALDEAALSGDPKQGELVRAAMFALKYHRLPTA